MSNKKKISAALAGAVFFAAPGMAGAYNVKAGDTLYKIAEKNKISVRELMKANDLRSTTIFPGQKLVIPGQTVRVSPGVPARVTDRAAVVDKAVGTAEEYVGNAKYVFGAYDPPNAFDCSSLTYHAFKVAGVDLVTRGSYNQVKLGKSVPLAQVKRGDLLFFATSGTGVVSHVGIARDSETMVHASGSSSGIKVSSFKSNYYTSHFVDARRIVE